MPKIYRARRRDANEPQIVRALESVGASVHRLDETGAPDLLVGWCAKTFLIEIKRPLGKRGGKSKSKLTDDQVTFWQTWKGGKLHAVRSSQEALRAIGAIGG